MAKRKGFDFASFIDTEALEKLAEEESRIAPSKEEVELVKNSEGDIVMLPISRLSSYHNHTYKVLENEDMEALTDSIRDMGVILPLLVRDKGREKYEIISGHRRKFAAKKAGLKEVPCKIIDADDATADLMMVDTNLHREEILPSEKAKSYDLKIKAMKKKGLLDEAENESFYEEQLAKDVKSSRVNIYRYRKLLKLAPELLDLVDSKEIAVNAGAKLAAIPADQQGCITEALKTAQNPVTMDAADTIVAASKAGLTTEKVIGILDGNFRPRSRTAPRESKAIKEKNIKSAYPEKIKKLSGKDKEAFIIDCIKAYTKSHDTWNDIKL